MRKKKEYWSGLPFPSSGDLPNQEIKSASSVKKKKKFLCVYAPQLLYPFICQWTSRLLPCSSYCKQCCNEQWDTCVFFNFGLLRVYAQLFKESPYCLPQWLYQFPFPQTAQEHSLFSTPSPVFIVCRLFDDGHSDWYEVISHCSFDLHFSNDE